MHTMQKEALEQTQVMGHQTPLVWWVQNVERIARLRFHLVTHLHTAFSR